MAYFKNWRCGSYRFSHGNGKDFGYQELKEYFFIDGSEAIYCKKDFGRCKAGRYYGIIDGGWAGCSFIVIDWGHASDGIPAEAGYEDWPCLKYMKEA